MTDQQFQDHAHLIIVNLNREEIERHTLEWRDCKGSEVFEKIRNTSPIVTLTNAENHAFGATAIDVVPLEIRGYFIPLFIGVKLCFVALPAMISALGI